MHVGLLGAPFPSGDDDVALDTLWPRRLALWHFALGDAVRPLPKIFQRRAAEGSGLSGHLLAGEARLNAPNPGLLARLKLAELRRDRARSFLADLVAANAADVLHLLEPVDLLTA